MSMFFCSFPRRRLSEGGRESLRGFGDGPDTETEGYSVSDCLVQRIRANPGLCLSKKAGNTGVLTNC
jgi:hypothetical protein